MNLEEQLHALGQHYRRVQPTRAFQKLGWNVLKGELPAAVAYRKTLWYHPFQLVTALSLVVLLVGSGTVYAAQWAKPQDALFPVKVLSEQVAVRLAPTKAIRQTVAQTVMERRLEELKSAGKTNDKKTIDGAIEEYRKSREDIATTADTKDQHLKQELEKHDEEFRQFINRHAPDQEKKPTTPAPTEASGVTVPVPTEKREVKGAETDVEEQSTGGQKPVKEEHVIEWEK